MITVVIPTMWKYKPFIRFLTDLTWVSSIGEIIIIDNNPTERPDDRVLNFPRIKLVTFGHNIYVNPAWNLGVEQAQYDKICLLNDDVIVDLKIFNRMNMFLNPSVGLCGICPGLTEEFGHLPIDTGEINLIHTPFQYNARTHFGLGTLMFFHKDVYIPVIEGLDLYWGDNFIYDTLYYKMNNNYLITNCFYYSPNAQTTSTIENANEILNRESMIYNREMPKIIHEIISSR